MDYIFYKIFINYKKKKDSPVVSGICFLIVLEAFIFFFLIMIFNFSTNYLLSIKNLSKEVCYAICYGIFFIVIVLNLNRYGVKRRREQIIEKCRKGKDRFKTWQIALLPVLFLALSVLVIVIGKKW